MLLDFAENLFFFKDYLKVQRNIVYIVFEIEVFCNNVKVLLSYSVQAIQCILVEYKHNK